MSSDSTLSSLLFDTHAHVQNPKFDADRAEALDRAKQAGVARVLNLGTRLEDSRVVVEMARASEQCLAAVGVHPSDLDDWSAETEAGLMELARDPHVVVYGEIGIDYFRNTFERGMQRRIFRRQLAMARELGLPVSIHCREAYDDMIADLRAEHGADIGGVAHCFAGTREHARAILEMGLSLGVGGTSTYPKSEELRAVLKEVGIDSIVLETDAPYLAPQKHRSSRNEPAFVAATAAKMAELYGVTLEEVKTRTWKNAVRMFRLDDAARGRAKK